MDCSVTHEDASKNSQMEKLEEDVEILWTLIGAFCVFFMQVSV